MNQSLLKVAKELAKDLYDAGVIDAKKFKELELDCSMEIKDYSANQIQRLRRREKASQTAFAKMLNTSPSTVRQWEQGLKHPRGTSLKLLSLVDKFGIEILLA